MLLLFLPPLAPPPTPPPPHTQLGLPLLLPSSTQAQPSWGPFLAAAFVCHAVCRTLAHAAARRAVMQGAGEGAPLVVVALWSLPLLGVSHAVGALCKRLQLPQITGYLLTGVLGGPHGLRLLSTDATR